MNKYTIGTRILLAVMIPMVGLIAFAGAEVVGKWSDYREMRSLQTLAELSPQVSAVVHELQKERGTSAGYIGSNGREFAEMLGAQKKESSVRIQELEQSLQDFDASSYGKEFQKRLDEAVTRLGELDATRKKVETLGMKLPDMASWYTGTIADMLGVVSEMALLSGDAEVTRSITA